MPPLVSTYLLPRHLEWFPMRQSANLIRISMGSGWPSVPPLAKSPCRKVAEKRANIKADPGASSIRASTVHGPRCQQATVNGDAQGPTVRVLTLFLEILVDRPGCLLAKWRQLLLDKWRQLSWTSWAFACSASPTILLVDVNAGRVLLQSWSGHRPKSRRSSASGCSQVRRRLRPQRKSHQTLMSN